MKLKTVLLATVFLAGTVSAHSFSIQDLNSQNFNTVKEEFNSYDQFPGFLSSLVGDQTINLHVRSSEVNKTVGVDLNGMEINSVKSGGFEDPTLEVWASESQVDSIVDSGKPLEELNKKLKSEEIRYKSYGKLNSAKFFLAEKAIRLASLF